RRLPRRVPGLARLSGPGGARRAHARGARRADAPGAPAAPMPRRRHGPPGPLDQRAGAPERTPRSQRSPTPAGAPALMPSWQEVLRYWWTVIYVRRGTAASAAVYVSGASPLTSERHNHILWRSMVTIVVGTSGARACGQPGPKGLPTWGKSSERRIRSDLAAFLRCHLSRTSRAMFLNSRALDSFDQYL